MTPKEWTDKNIITKQVVVNTPTSARLLPITADEKVIDEIQQALTELEELKKNLHEYFELEVKSVTQAIYDRERHRELKHILIKEGKKCLI